MRVDGFSKMQAIASPRSASSQWAGDVFIAKARSSSVAQLLTVQVRDAGEVPGVWARVAPTPLVTIGVAVVAPIAITRP